MVIRSLWVDHRPRIEFYVRNGLIPHSPTEEQLAAATRKVLMTVGVAERLAFYAKHPLQLFPTARKARRADIPIKEIISKGAAVAIHDAECSGSRSISWEADPFFDRMLKWTLLFPPARLVTRFVFNPWVIVPTTGLNIPVKLHIVHLLQTDHNFPLWDLQIIHSDPGALDELERQVDATLAGIGLKARLNRALATCPGYFEFLKEQIQRVRRFDYPPVPRDLGPITVDLVAFLKYATTL